LMRASIFRLRYASCPTSKCTIYVFVCTVVCIYSNVGKCCRETIRQISMRNTYVSNLCTFGTTMEGGKEDKASGRSEDLSDREWGKWQQDRMYVIGRDWVKGREWSGQNSKIGGPVSLNGMGRFLKTRATANVPYSGTRHALRSIKLMCFVFKYAPDKSVPTAHQDCWFVLWMYFRTMYLETGATTNNIDPDKQGTPLDGENFIEPPTCPYQVPDITTKAAESKRSAATNGGTIDSSIEKGSMGVGKPANNSLQAPSNTSANEQNFYGINPVASNVDLSVKYFQVLLYGMIP